LKIESSGIRKDKNMSEEKKITQKALKDHAHDQGMNISGKAVALFKELKASEALQIVDLAAKVAKNNNRKTIKDSDVQVILDTLAYARPSC
jgi:histone H3/H4